MRRQSLADVQGRAVARENVMMDARQFDVITRRFAGTFPRRALLSLLTAVVLPQLPGFNGAVEAGCKKVGKRCDKNKDCCSGAKCSVFPGGIRMMIERAAPT
jgi:hypothetical protein